MFGPKLFFLPPSPSLPIILSFIFHGVIVSSLRLPVPISFCQLNKVGCLASLTKKSMSKKLVGCGALCVCVCVCVCVQYKICLQHYFVYHHINNDTRDQCFHMSNEVYSKLATAHSIVLWEQD